MACAGARRAVAACSRRRPDRRICAPTRRGAAIGGGRIACGSSRPPRCSRATRSLRLCRSPQSADSSESPCLFKGLARRQPCFSAVSGAFPGRFRPVSTLFQERRAETGATVTCRSAHLVRDEELLRGRSIRSDDHGNPEARCNRMDARSSASVQRRKQSRIDHGVHGRGATVRPAGKNRFRRGRRIFSALGGGPAAAGRGRSPRSTIGRKPLISGAEFPRRRCRDRPSQSLNCCSMGRRDATNQAGDGTKRPSPGTKTPASGPKSVLRGTRLDQAVAK